MVAPSIEDPNPVDHSRPPAEPVVDARKSGRADYGSGLRHPPAGTSWAPRAPIAAVEIKVADRTRSVGLPLRPLHFLEPSVTPSMLNEPAYSGSIDRIVDALDVSIRDDDSDHGEVPGLGVGLGGDHVDRSAPLK